MTTALALVRGERWSQVRWHADGSITFDAPVSQAGKRGLWVGEGKGVAILVWNGRFQFAAPIGKGKGETFRDAVVMLANPELRRQYLKGE